MVKLDELPLAPPLPLYVPLIRLLERPLVNELAEYSLHVVAVLVPVISIGGKPQFFHSFPVKYLLECS
jgi:hypothetical protein